MSPKLSAICEFPPPATLTVCFGTWVGKLSDLCAIAEAVANSGLSPGSDEATPFVLPAWPRIVLYFLGVAMDAKGDCDLSDILRSNTIHSSSKLKGALSVF